MARRFLVLAQAPKGPTLFLVGADTAGVALGRPEAIMGLRASGMRTVYFSDVRVGPDAVVGQVGDGLRLVEEARPALQLGAAAALCGCVAGALRAATQFAKERTQFGQPVGSFQAVSDTLASADVALAGARSLVLAAAAHVGSADAPLWAARAKACASELGIVATRQAIRVQGGTGFMREGGTERFARDARALQFVGEPGAVQREVIREALLGPLPMPR